MLSRSAPLAVFALWHNSANIVFLLCTSHMFIENSSRAASFQPRKMFYEISLFEVPNQCNIFEWIVPIGFRSLEHKQFILQNRMKDSYPKPIGICHFFFVFCSQKASQRLYRFSYFCIYSFNNLTKSAFIYGARVNSVVEFVVRSTFIFVVFNDNFVSCKPNEK